MIIDAQHHYRGRNPEALEMSSRLKWMEESSVEMAVLSNNMQYFYNQGLSTWVAWNDELASVERERPDRFVACPSLPIFDGKSALSELERVVSKNEAKAVFIQPYKWRIDYDYLLPLYEKLNDLGLPIFFHPVHTDLSVEDVYGTSGLGAAVGFPFNTTLAISRFISSGILDSCRNLKLVIPHLGGAFPFLLGRLSETYDPKKLRALHPPSEYLDNFYFDIVSYRKEAFDFAASVLGYNRLVFGSDYGCPDKRMIRPKVFQAFVEGLPIAYSEKQGILGQHLADLLKIKVPQKKEEEQRVTATLQSP